MSSVKITFEAGQIYHIWTHANGSENLFRSEMNYRNFMNRYIKYIHPVVETYAYCLMPNHWHVMLRVRIEDEILDYLKVKKKDSNLLNFDTLGGLSNCISRQFSDLLNGYTQSYNYQYNRKGSLFIPNFKRKLIKTEEYFARLIVYIHNNPVYHGFVSDPGEWRFSSYVAYKQNKETRLNIGEGLDWFGGIEGFDELHRLLTLEKLATTFSE